MRTGMAGLRRRRPRLSTDLFGQDFRMERRETAPETKDPSGGTTGRVKPYGRLGWMGARAEYSLDGEG